MKRRTRIPGSWAPARHRQFMAEGYGGATYVNPDIDEIFEYPNPNVKIASVFVPDLARDFVSTQTTGDGAQDLAKVLEAKHPIYDEYCQRWDDWFNWYAGQHIDRYIQRHQRESASNFRKRQARAYYYNYTGAIVELIAAFVYSKSIVRSFFLEDEQLAQQEHIEKNDFWLDCDLKHTNINEFMQKIYTFTKIWGFVDVVTDMPRLQEEILNEQDRLNAAIRPYLYYILPMNAINWEMDDKGEYLWYRWRERIDRQLNPFSMRRNEIIWEYWTWTRDAWYRHVVITEKGKKSIARLLDAGEHELGVVPVTRFYGKRDMLDKYIGQSFVEPIGKINVDIANSVSLLTEEIRSKVFNILVMEDPNSGMDGDANGADLTQTGVEIGNNNALLWAGQHQPYYLAPASDPGRFIMEWIEKSTDEIYKLATLWTDTGIRESRSGVSYSYEFNRTNAMLADNAQLMQEGEVAVHKLYCKWLGEEWHGLIDYPDSYDVEVLEQEIQTTTSARNLVRSPSFSREMEKRVVRKVLNNATTDVLETIMDEIDTLPERQVQQMAIEQEFAAKAQEAEGQGESTSSGTGEGEA